MFCHSRMTKSLLILVAAVTLAGSVYASNWKKLSPSKSPSARAYPAMAYDPVSKKVVLFGGFGASSYLNDTWTFDGATWQHVKTAKSPGARNGASMAFDKRSQKLVMFGGFAGTTRFLNDTWLWDGATSTWTQAQMKPAPPKLTGVMSFTDSQSGSAMMFGGYNRLKPAQFSGSTWRWTGTSWKKLNPSTNPYGRAWGVAAFDPVRKNVVLASGVNDTVRTDNTWTWDGADWTQQFPSVQVGAIQGAASTFDPAVNAVVIFGGFTNQETNDTWAWDGTKWATMNPTKLPPVREGAGMAYDSNSHQTLIFGGLNYGTGTVMGDTWQLVGR